MQPSNYTAYGLLHNDLVDWFVPEALLANGDLDELRARLIPLFTAGLIAIGAIFVFVYAFPLDMLYAAAVIMIGLVLVAFAPVLMRRVGRYEPASHWISLNFYWVVLVLTLLTGGLDAPALRWMAVVPVYVLIFTGIRFGLVWVALVTLTYLAFYAMPTLGYPVPQRLSASELQLLRLVGMAGLTVLVIELFIFYGWLVESLRAARQTLRDNDRRKNQFLAMLGHELRNPFSSIANGLAVLERISTPDRADRQIEIMSRQATALGRMLDDLLDIARITRGTLELQREPVDLVAVVDSALETISGQYASSERDIRRHYPDEPVRVYGDRVRLEQVFNDLLGNAFKYTDTDGTIRIAIEPGEAYVRASIRDDGRGMSEEELEHIFEMFDRGHAETYDAKGGLGIGLTVAKRLVELHGGRIDAHSPGPGRGSEFVVHLPVSEHQTAETAPPPGD